MSIRLDVNSIIKSGRQRRQILYAPSNQLKKLQKGATLSNLDVIAFDLEDGVNPSQKDIARKTLHEFLRNKPSIKPELAVRINALDSQDSMKDLNEIFLDPIIQSQVKCIIMPKVEDVHEIDFLERWLRFNNMKNTKLLAMIETPLGLTKVNSIASRSPLVEGLIFGAEDFKSAAGISKIPPPHTLDFARSSIVTAARAFGKQAIDMVSLDFRHPEIIKAEALESKAIGMTGRQVIHPMQVEIVNSAFSPTQKEQEKYIQTIKTFVKTWSSGKGVFENESGTMVELPHVTDAIRQLYMAGKSIPEIQQIIDFAL